ncbi:hypothetical protein BDV93DRAFT_176587 [Ceratobasidium sp. AG-I]|nr:hypothetical protein BDV93DRAFT_176587 [Ceratobasidium sp. AG-I]
MASRGLVAWPMRGLIVSTRHANFTAHRNFVLRSNTQSGALPGLVQWTSYGDDMVFGLDGILALVALKSTSRIRTSLGPRFCQKRVHAHSNSSIHHSTSPRAQSVARHPRFNQFCPYSG